MIKHNHNDDTTNKININECSLRGEVETASVLRILRLVYLFSHVAFQSVRDYKEHSSRQAQVRLDKQLGASGIIPPFG